MSLSLRHAAEQLVYWHPWDADAWDKARKLERPVLLDVGSSWCGWCEKMDRESYSDARTANYINQNFIAIKVERDSQGKLAAQLESAQALLNFPAGLPLTAVLMPDGRMVAGATFLPARASKGKVSLLEFLQQALSAFDQNRARIEAENAAIPTEVATQ